eukprot:CAMPEP_0182903466 /NCGR_PEP_ID=MMETSP0034_2-20130328/31305_1 /TAXON_ID=156128 /ORGANISM="Nephroselmis pyriformis, Strain CCMP717" /LENGTH=143 /DNA_ID=CAMNT_0025038353 /DNA_START=14 /DNA_END=441 /DNA_ORIENTATION=-
MALPRMDNISSSPSLSSTMTRHRESNAPTQEKLGVLGRGADKHDCPGLHVRQEGVLLHLIKAVDLVHKKDRAAAEAPEQLRGICHGLFDVRETCRDRREAHEMVRRGAPDDVGEGCLAAARWSPEDHVGDVIRPDEGAKHPSG